MENNSRPIDDGAAILGASRGDEQWRSAKVRASAGFWIRGLDGRLALSGAGSAPMPMGHVCQAGKNPELFLKGEGLRPIYRLGGDYCHKGRKKKLKSHEKKPLTKHIRHKTKESLSELKINFNSLGEKS
ncbi:hypothetical protein ACB288_17695 [Aeromonas taiwanensis]